MSGQDTRPTPASGMPAVVAASPEAQPSGDEIVAEQPRSFPATDPAEKLLAAFESFREETRARDAERDRKLDERFAQVHRRIDEVAGETKQNARLWADQAELLTKVAGAAATAADLALEAKQATSRAPEEMKQLVESALRIQSTAHAASMADAVKTAVQPIRDDVDSLRTGDERQERVQRQLCAVMGVDYDAAADSTDTQVTKPKANMADLAKGNQKAMGASLITLAIIIAEIILRAMGASARVMPHGRAD